jgi:hypothetical protein
MKGRWIAAALALGLCASAAAAQNSLKQQLIGTWEFVVAEIAAPDGKKSFPFGEVPKGILIFTPDGRFAQIHVAADAPKIASNNRLTGTAEEYAAIMRRSLSVFGTYTVDEDKKTVTYQIVSSSYPNWEGEAQTRAIDRAHRRRVRQHQSERGGRTRRCVEFLSAGQIGARISPVVPELYCLLCLP